MKINETSDFKKILNAAGSSSKYNHVWIPVINHLQPKSKNVGRNC